MTPSTINKTPSNLMPVPAVRRRDPPRYAAVPYSETSHRALPLLQTQVPMKAASRPSAMYVILTNSPKQRACPNDMGARP